MVRKTVIAQLQTVGEGALEKIAQSPATRTAFQGAVSVKERGERFFHTLDSIEERLTAIEARLAALEKPKPKRTPTSSGSATRRARAAGEPPKASS